MHLINSLRQRAAKTLWKKERGEGRNNSQSPQCDVWQVVRVDTCAQDDRIRSQHHDVHTHITNGD